MSLTWHQCVTVLSLMCRCLYINVLLTWHQCVTVFTQCITDLTLMWHCLDINVSMTDSQCYFFNFIFLILSHVMSSKNVNLCFIYRYLRCTVHGFRSFCRCISIYLKCTWTLLPLPLWACQPVKELFQNPTWMLLWDLWRNMLQKLTPARYVF